MVVKVSNKEWSFTIEFNSPTDEDFVTIDGPEIEGQTSEYEVYCDRKLKELESLLELGYRFEVIEP